MALLVDVVESTVFGDQKVVVADVTFDDADASTALTPSLVGLQSILTVISGVTDGGHATGWAPATGSFTLWEGADGAPLGPASTTDADGDVVRVVVIGQ